MRRGFYLFIAVLLANLFYAAHAYAVPSSYPACNYGYRIENNQVFYCDGENETEILGADANSFRLVDDLDFAKDKNAVYCQGTNIQADPTTFTQIENAVGYFKDSSSVFYNCVKLANSNPPTFQNINGDFNRDKNNLYYQGSIIKADKKSFEVIGGGYAKDSSNVYFRYSKVANADVTSFKIRAVEDYSDYCGGDAVDSMDKNAFFMDGMKVCGRSTLSSIVPAKPAKNVIYAKVSTPKATATQDAASHEIAPSPTPDREIAKNSAQPIGMTSAEQKGDLQYIHLLIGAGLVIALIVIVSLFFRRNRS